MLSYARRSLRLLAALGTAAIAVAPLALSSPAVAGLAVESHDLLTFDYRQTGANEEEAVRIASIRAVRATVGRVMFSDYAVQGRDLLDAYISKNWPDFVASSYVLERRAERDSFGVRVRIQTFPEKLTRDLREKKFLYLPEPNPVYMIYVAESVDGVLDESHTGFNAVADALKAEGHKVTDVTVKAARPDADITRLPGALNDVRIVAMKAGAEILIAGSVITAHVSDQQIYYDKMSTYETLVRVQMIKVDDGSVLAEKEITIRASDKDEATARREAVTKSMTEASRSLMELSAGKWTKLAFDAPKFSVMFTDLTEDEAKLVSRHVQSFLDYGTKLHAKSWFGNVAIFNVDTDRAFAALERAIIAFKAFDLRISDRQGKRITVDVQH